MLQNFKTLFFQLIIISTDFEKYYKINLALLFFKKIRKTASKVATVTIHNLSYFLQTNTQTTDNKKYMIQPQEI